MRPHQRWLFLLIIGISCFGPYDPYNPAPDSDAPNDTTSNQQLQQGITAYWKCNDSGKTLTDETGNFEGTINGPTFDTGIEGTALSFNGRGDVVLVSTRKNTGLNFGTGDFTISLWVKPFIYASTADSNYQVVISNGVEGEHGISLSIIEKSFCIFVGRNKNELRDKIFDATVHSWHHCVLLRRRSTVELYINTQKIAFYTNDDNVTSADSNFIIGDDASTRTNNEFSGMIDEIKCSKTAWDMAKITGEFTAFKSFTE